MDELDTDCFLPEDLFPDILSRLQVRDLLRFRCVSRSWRALIDDPSFIRTHHNARYVLQKAQGVVPLLLWNCTYTIQDNLIHCYLLSKQQGNDTILNLTAEFQRDTISITPNAPDPLFDISCRGSANGIICLEICHLEHNLSGRGVHSCGLWNPASREFKVVDYPRDVPDQSTPGEFFVVAFVFDPISSDFKIMVETHVASDISVVYMVYTLSTNSWNRVCEPSLLGATAFAALPEMGSCFNGVYYWTARLIKENENELFRILSYNFSTEKFRFSKPPQGALSFANRSDNVRWDIGLYKERLALFFTESVLHVAETSVEIWVVSEFGDDFGVPLEWQCLISIKPIFECLYKCFGAQRMDGDLLFLMHGRDSCLYNFTTGKIRRLGISINMCFEYVESLFPLSRRVVLR